jgi:hypothetical protein
MRIRSIRAVLFAFVVLVSSASFGQVAISVRFGPPALPVYEQPLCPAEDYIWTPGFWAWSDDDGDYYWVPGTWVLAPEVGFLWTPPWWGWEGGVFIFHEGFWGPHIGFYGGINYGFGYFGEGFAGGRWDNGHFSYNRSVTNVNVTIIHNVYNEAAVNRTENRVSYNGGEGGITRRPTPQEENAERERHAPPAAAQLQHIQTARASQELRASANHGKPPIAATARPGEFSGRETVAAREAGGSYNPPANRGGEERRATPGGGDGAAPPARVVHPNDIPLGERPPASHTGDEKLDKKYQQEQEKLQQKQDQERQKLQQKQDQEHQRLTQQKANDAKQQQVEQRHQQQTQQLQQRHAQQQQSLQQRQAPPSRSQAEPQKKP